MEGRRRVFTEREKKDITSFVEEMRKCRSLPGLTLAVVDREGSLFARGFGQADIKRGVPVTVDTPFPIASTTKAFTTTLLAMLISDGGSR